MLYHPRQSPRLPAALANVEFAELRPLLQFPVDRANVNAILL